MLLARGNFSTFVEQLRASDGDLQKKLQLTSQIRDCIEIVHTNEYDNFLSTFMPEFMRTLKEVTKPQMQDNAEHRIRNVILEILNRLPNNQVMAPFVRQLLPLVMELLKTDNEENAVICLRIIIDLHKKYRPSLEHEVQTFLQTVLAIYDQLPNTVERIFSPAALHEEAAKMEGGGGAGASASGGDDGDKNEKKTFVPSLQSFKVLTECPIIVVLLFQLYPRFLEESIPKFVPQIIRTLDLKAPVLAHRVRRQAYTDFIAAQVKTLSFLAYILRRFVNMLKPHAEAIPWYVIQLLHSCPPESATIRKELLIATRHILATEFRYGFVNKMDQLLDEQVLVGTGRTSYETLRPLAHSTLADLVHHIRNQLSLPQLLRTVYLYSRNMHDPSLPVAIQTMSGKLLLNLVECIATQNDEHDRARTLLVRILDTFVTKFGTLQHYIPDVIRLYRIGLRERRAEKDEQVRLLKASIDALQKIKDDSDSANKDDQGDDDDDDTNTAMDIEGKGEGEGDDTKDGSTKDDDHAKDKDAKAEGAKADGETKAEGEDGEDGEDAEEDLSSPWETLNPPIETSANNKGTADAIKDCRLLMRTLAQGLKTIVWAISSCHQPAILAAQHSVEQARASGNPHLLKQAEVSLQQVSQRARMLSESESQIFVRLLHDGLACFKIYSVSLPQTNDTEQKEVLDIFASVFTLVDPRTFKVVFADSVELLFDHMLSNQTMLTIARHFLANPSVSTHFADILLSFLVKRLELLGTLEQKPASVLLRLFKLVFASVELFRDNELALQPHLRTIVVESMQRATQMKEPTQNYFLLLRALFRSIGGGEFELLYKEFLPLLPVLLEGLNRLQQSAHKQTMRDLFVELCLTVPVRLSALLPYLRYLMRPLVLSLQSGSELVAQGLRTLELCVDNLTPDFLDPIIKPVRPDLISALWKHLRPHPYAHGPHALRILGKLGGRNRHFLDDKTTLNFKGNPEEGLSLRFSWLADDAAASATLGATASASDAGPSTSTPASAAAAAADDAGQTRQTTKRSTRRGRARKADAPAPMEMDTPSGATAETATAAGGAPDEFVLRLDWVVDMAKASLLTSTDAFYRRQAFQVIRMFISSMMDLTFDPSEFAVRADLVNRELDTELVPSAGDPDADPALPDMSGDLGPLDFDALLSDDAEAIEATLRASLGGGGEAGAGAGAGADAGTGVVADARLGSRKTQQHVVAEMRTFKILLICAFVAAANQHLGPDAKEFAKCVTRHFALLMVAPCSAAVYPSEGARAQDPRCHSLDALDMSVFADAVVALLTAENRTWGAASIMLLDQLLETLTVLLGGTRERAATHPIFDDLAARFLHCCYHRSWYRKSGGCMGIRWLVEHLPVAWVSRWQVQFVKMLSFVLGALPGGLAAAVVDEAAACLMIVVIGPRADKHFLPISSTRHRSMGKDDHPLQVALRKMKRNKEQNTGDAAAGAGGAVPMALEEGAGGPAADPVAEGAAAAAAAAAAASVLAKQVAKAREDSAFEFADAVRPELMVLLAQQLMHPITAIRDHARACVEALAALKEVTVAELLSTAEGHLPFGNSCVISRDALERTFQRTRDAAKQQQQQQAAAAAASAGGQEVPPAVADDSLLTLSARNMLASKPFDAQIGFLDGLTFCLTAEPPAIQVTAQVVAMVEAALNVAQMPDADLQNLRPTYRRSASQLPSLRVACLEVLASAVTHPELHAREPSRNSIISVFFKALTMGSADMIAVARRGLQRALTQSEIQKSLLQTSLKPVLRHLAHYRSLTIPLLEGLGRLLELLSSCFNVILGEKLFQHVKMWAEPGQPIHNYKVATAILEVFHLLPAQASKFMERLVLITLTIERNLPLDVRLAPFRLPLTKFLNRYPNLSFNYFLPKLSEAHYSNLFLHVLDNSVAESLRRFVESQASILRRLIAGDASWSPAQHETVRFQTVRIAHTLIQHNPAWIADQRELIDALISYWNSENRIQRMQHEERHDIVTLQEPRMMLDIFLEYCRRVPTEIDLFFHMLQVFTMRSVIDFSFLQNFFMQDVAQGYSNEQKAAILQRFIGHFAMEPYTQAHRVQMLQLLIIPMLSSAFATGVTSELLSDATAEVIVHKLLMPDQFASPPPPPITSGATEPAKPADFAPKHQDALRIQLLQLATLLVRYCPQILAPYRKELIKFAWNHLRSEDATSKNCGYVLVCRFIEAYDTPQKVILQVYVALLRAHQPDVRILVKQALDILTPALPRRLPAGDHRYPTWIKWTKKIIVEESHSLPQLLHIWRLLVRHQELFYPTRAQFVPQMVNSLARIGLPTTSALDNRVLAVDLAEVIVGWEVRSRQDASAAQEPGGDPQTGPTTTPGEPTAENIKSQAKGRGTKRGRNDDDEDADVDGGAAGNDAQEDDDAAAPPKRSRRRTKRARGTSDSDVSSAKATGAAGKGGDGTGKGDGGGEPPSSSGAPSSLQQQQSAIIEMVVNFLIRIACSCITGDGNREAVLLAQRCVLLLKRALMIWPRATVKWNYFEKVFATYEHAPPILTALEILNIVVDSQLALYNTNTLMALHATVSRLFGSDNLRITSRLCVLLNKLQQRFKPSDEHPQTQQFYDRIFKIIEVSWTRNKSNFSICSVLLLETISKNHHELLDRFLSGLIGVMERLLEEHVRAVQSMIELQYRRQVVQPKPLHQTIVQALISTITLINYRVGTMSTEYRQRFLRLLIVLIEKSNDITLLSKITGIVRGWVQSAGMPYPTSKEKTQVLVKMMCFEHFQNAKLHTEFLLLVHEIYANPEFRRTELTARLEPAFMMGLRSHNTDVRRKFFEIFDASVIKTVANRATYVIAVQNWESLGGFFWIKQALDLVLEVMDGDRSLAVADDCARLPAINAEPIPGIGGLTPAAPTVDGLPEAAPADAGLPSPSELLEAHGAFLGRLGELCVKDLRGPIRELCHQNPNMACYLWVRLFPLIWAQLSDYVRGRLARSLRLLLSKTYHHMQRHQQPNVVQALLEGISRARPRIPLHVDLIKYLGAEYNAWFTAIPMLEEITQRPPGSPEEEEERARAFTALGELYGELNEQDAHHAVWRRRKDVRRETLCALSYEQHGLYQHAQDQFFGVMTMAQSDVGPGEFASADELALWEAHWIECARQLNQWDVLSKYATQAEQAELLIECAWKTGDWMLEKELLTQTSLQRETPQRKIYQIYVSIFESHSGNVDRHCQEAIEMCLQQWSSLPDVVSFSHLPLLRQFQQFVELTESAQIHSTIMNPDQNQTIPELQGILNTWRERLPNAWDDIVTWNELIQWRHLVFAAINVTFQPLVEANPTLAYTGYHETAWTINRFAQVARKHGLLDICLNSLAKIYSLPNIEIPDAFMKLREQARCFQELTMDLESGLTVINHTNLDYFSDEQKSEFFQIKGEILQQMGRYEDANVAFSTAVATSDTLGSSWAAWGSFADAMYEETGSMPMAAKAVTCYLLAAAHGGHSGTHDEGNVARLLWLLSFDDAAQSLGKMVQSYADGVPSWMWITWIPQLVLALTRPEGYLAKVLLQGVGAEYPQALYCSLRTALFDFKDRARMQQQNEGAGVPDSLAIRYGLDVMNVMQKRHPLLVDDMELLVEETTARFKAETSEELLRILHAFAVKCHLADVDPSTPLPRNLVAVIDRVRNTYFVTEPRSARSRVHFRRFVARYKDLFQQDFETSNITYGSFLQTLERWLPVLEAEVSALPGILNLEDISPALASFENLNVEVFGQYFERTEPMDHVSLERFHSEVVVVRRDFGAARQLVCIGENAQLSPFLVEYEALKRTRREERVCQLLRSLNRVFAEGKETRRRALSFAVPVVLPLSSTVRIVSDDVSLTSLKNVFIQHCHRKGISVDTPIKAFKQHRAATLEELSGGNASRIDNAMQATANVAALEAVGADLVPDTILEAYIHKSFPTATHHWTFKRHFCQQLGVLALIGHALRARAHKAQHLQFALNTGDLVPSSLLIEFNSDSMLSQGDDTVPFRLTRNMAKFMGPTGIDGPFNAAMTAAARVLGRPDAKWAHQYLTLFLRDELVHVASWQPQALQQGLPPPPQDGTAPPPLPVEEQVQLRTAVKANVKSVKATLLRLADTPVQGSMVGAAVDDLIHAARNPVELAAMPCVWHPWL